jgi:DnaK suppressor protein
MDDTEARQLLEAERARLEELLAAETAAVDEQQGQRDAGHADEAKHIVDRELERSERQRIAQELAAVEDAFARLEAGTYGISEVSGEPIPDERLRAVPYARATAAEQELLDKQARVASPSNPDLRREHTPGRPSDATG